MGDLTAGPLMTAKCKYEPSGPFEHIKSRGCAVRTTTGKPRAGAPDASRQSVAPRLGC